MNRRERKAMEKRLGLDKYKKNLPRSVKFKMMRENIIEGKKKQAQMKEIIRVQKDRKNDDIASARISSIATDLIINKGMDWVKAHEEAVRIYKEETESTTEK